MFLVSRSESRWLAELSKFVKLLIFEDHQKLSYGRVQMITLCIAASRVLRVFGRFWIRWKEEVLLFPTNPQASKTVKNSIF